MEISILEKKHSLIKHIIESKNEDLLDTIDLFFTKSELEVPLDVQKMVIERMEIARKNPETLISELEFDDYLNTL